MILAGGEATRLPGKLALDAGGVPLVVRVARNVAAGRETVVSVNAAFGPPLDVMLGAPLIVDRWARLGPIGGFLSALPALRSPLVFAVAGDAPFVTAALIDALVDAWRPGDGAVVPEHGDESHPRIEPLAALYDRVDVLRAANAELAAGGRSLHGVLGRLRVRRVRFAHARTFANVNTPADYESAAASLASASEKFARP
jgi:molybdenum cofactor guanylyltransferase